MLYYGIAPESHHEEMVNFIASRALANPAVHLPSASVNFHFSAYSSFYAIEVLHRFRRTEEAERMIRREWRRMLDGGAWTCWEYFVPSHSLCHAWAASPAWFLTAFTLGIRYAEPGNPDRLLFDPRPGSLDYAEGTFPHPRGPVRVSWHKNPDGSLTHEIDAPAGVEITCDPILS